MTHDSDQMRVIHDALFLFITHEGTSAAQRDIAARLLKEDYPKIPVSVPRPKDAPTPKPLAVLEAEQSTEPNTRLDLAPDGGYFVMARSARAFKWYIVEAFAEHHMAEMLRAQLEEDPAERQRAIRDARDWDFYNQKLLAKRERTPREPKVAPVTFSFDK